MPVTAARRDRLPILPMLLNGASKAGPIGAAAALLPGGRSPNKMDKAVDQFFCRWAAFPETLWNHMLENQAAKAAIHAQVVI